MTADQVRQFLKLLGGGKEGCLSLHESRVITHVNGLDGSVPMNPGQTASHLHRNAKSVKRLEQEAVEKLVAGMRA